MRSRGEDNQGCYITFYSRGIPRKILFLLAENGLEGGLSLGYILRYLDNRGEVKEETVKKALYRLKKRGLIKNNSRKWLLTPEGERQVRGFEESILNRLGLKLEEEEVRLVFSKLIRLWGLNDYLSPITLSSNPNIAYAIDSLKNARVIEASFRGSSFKITPSFQLRRLLNGKGEHRLRGLVQIKQLKDNWSIKKYRYLRIFRLKEKPLDVEKLKNYVEGLKARFPERGISLLEHEDYLVLTNPRKILHIVFKLGNPSFKIYVVREDFEAKKEIVNHVLRCVLTKLKVLEKPIYYRV
jgi:hypothetical protein